MDHHAAPGSLPRSFKRHHWAQNHTERTVGNHLGERKAAHGFLEGAAYAESFDGAVAELVRFGRL